MLSDPDKRKVYDQFGEEVLKNGFGAGAGGGVGFNGFHPRAAEEIFAEVCTRQMFPLQLLACVICRW